MKSSSQLVFFGVGNEYVLHSLYSYFVEKGFNCLEITMPNKKKMKEQILAVENDCILITSSHFALDQKAFDRLYVTDFSGILSLVEIIKLIEPKKIIYYPHDLSEPLIKDEPYYLSLVDLALLPSEDCRVFFSSVERCETVGWIKSFTNHVKKKDKLHQAIWFVSDVEHFKQIGIKAMDEQTQYLFKKTDIALKFPYWPGVEIFEKYFKQKGVTIYPSTDNSLGLITKHDYIITNGLSSVTREAVLLGKPVINLLEDYLDNGLQQKKLLGTLPGVYFSRYDTFDNVDLADLKSTPVKAQPFNFKKVETLIRELI